MAIKDDLKHLLLFAKRTSLSTNLNFANVRYLK